MNAARTMRNTSLFSSKASSHGATERLRPVSHTYSLNRERRALCFLYSDSFSFDSCFYFCSPERENSACQS